MGLLEALRDPQFRSDLGTNARQLGQSASNTIAEGVTMPVDALAWLLRKGGAQVPQNPLGGSDWAKQQGMMADVPQGAPKTAGEALGLLAPMAGTKQGVNALATALRQGGENLSNPAMLNKQAGGMLIDDSEKLNRVSGISDNYRLPNLATAVPKNYLPKQYGNETVTIYRGISNDVKNPSITPGDWVSLDKKYAKAHGTGKTGKSTVLEMQVPADHVGWAGTDMNEFFYVPR